MKSAQKNRIIWPLLFLFGITIFFFYKTFTHGFIPFPGDLLISEYKPWSSSSFLGYNPGSYPSKKQYFDTIRQMYPWRTFVNEQIKMGQIPLWNPHNFSGAPLLANLQSQVFYPLTIIYFLVNQKIAWAVLIILQPLLAAIFTYGYMKQLKASDKASLLSAIAYGFSLFMTAFLEYNTIGHVILWLPFILLMVELSIEQKKTLVLLGYVFGIVAAIFGGHLQLFASVFAFTIVYFSFRIFFDTKKTFGQKRSTYGLLVLLSILAVGLASIQLLPTAELVSLSARADHTSTDLITRLLIQPKQLFMIIAPDIFGNPATNNYLLGDSYPGKTLAIGIIPLFFALVCLWDKKRDNITKLYGGTIILLALIMVRSPISSFIYQFSLPFLSASAPTNNLFLLAFSLSILAGKGFDLWLNDKQISWKFLVGFFSLFILAWAMTVAKLFPIISKNLIFSTAIAGMFFFMLVVSVYIPKYKKVLAVIFIFITVGELWYFFQKFNPFIPTSLVFPQTPISTWVQEHTGTARIWGYGTAGIEANFATQLGIYSPDGYDPLYPNYYGAFLHGSKDGSILTSFGNTTRSDAIIANGFGEIDFAQNIYRKKILHLLNTPYILNRAENNATEVTFPTTTYVPVYSGNDWTIFKDSQALPRVFMTTSVQVAKTAGEFSHQFFNSNTDEKTVFLSQSLSQTIDQNAATGSAQLKTYTAKRLTIETQTPSTQLLFLSDTFYPGWRATIDGKETQILKADYAFRAIFVPKGIHTIIFSYEPTSFQYGIIISGISIISLIASLGWMTMKKDKHL